ncbi:YybH family protein [Roseobacter sinensis]|uniref:Nuclear transport factor 2 family protein n=1 Tax=Roseobacter sinensis TaxID=2931391 RepID=A0ABT3BLH7_9RHOB|nr:nuclear transport factor 2 family protein [Roseobacter sp. WL0113]MCV3274420.1 nuclear transport factor 2 family protein [Roseobacter sp. WL0113]
MRNDHNEITILCQRLGKAHYEKDADAIVGCYAPDAVIYSLAPPLKDKIDLVGTREWLKTWDGPILVDAEDVNLVVGEDTAWSTALNRMRGTKTDGTREDIWFRTTMCFRKLDGDWRIVHDHSSTPFYMDGSVRAAVDLEPDSSTA